MPDSSSVHIFVCGKVQGVFYRSQADQTARQLGLTGWVQNLADGRVEAVVEGPQDAVEAMIRWCHQGSAAAQVTNVEVEYIQPQALEEFEIR